MSTRQDALLGLSLVAEPGDPRMSAALQENEPQRIVELLEQSRTAADVDFPPIWFDRANGLDVRCEDAKSRARSSGLRWVIRGDENWPAGLDDLDHLEPFNGVAGAPPGLWIRGDAHLAELSAAAIAIVGARDATTYGCETASDLGADLADAGRTIISGAAYGIDACAHRGALAMGGPSIAVLAGGADVDYPRAHSGLISRIARDGLVISEQAPGATPMKARFLSRNRLIAALSRGAVVVEAARRSGSLNTLNWADQLSRVTMGVPGPVTSRSSVGVHEAIRTGKSILVTDAAQIMEATASIGDLDSATGRGLETAYDRLDASQQRTLDAIPWGKPRTTAEIARTADQQPTATVQNLRRLAAQEFVGSVGHGWILMRRADLDE